jgi:hypothetical protein
MTALGTAVTVLVLGCFVAWRATARERVKREQLEALEPGAFVLVRTPDHKQLLARVLSRGPSHFWIELMPGETRWWVPASAVEPAPEHSVRNPALLSRTPRPAPRPAMDSEI